jgi:hypothetical protein
MEDNFEFNSNFMNLQDRSSSSLPLYESLNPREGQHSITPEYLQRLSSILTSISPDCAEQVALLLIHHYQLTSSQPFDPTNPPYGIKMSPSGKGFSFDLKMLPASFIMLLGNYLYKAQGLTSSN